VNAVAAPPITLSALLELLAKARIVPRVEDGKLRYRAPRGAITQEIAEAVDANREQLIHHLLHGKWGQALAETESAINEAEQEPRLADVQRRVLGHYRTVARKHRDNHDDALLTWAEEVRLQMTNTWGLLPLGGL
jgi:hypothetical protein